MSNSNLTIDWDSEENTTNIRQTVALMRKGCGCKTSCQSSWCKCKRAGITVMDASVLVVVTYNYPVQLLVKSLIQHCQPHWSLVLKRRRETIESFSFSFFAVSAKRETRGPSRDRFYTSPVSRSNVWKVIFPFGFHWAYLPFSSRFETLCKLLADVLHLRPDKLDLLFLISARFYFKHPASTFIIAFCLWHAPY